MAGIGFVLRKLTRRDDLLGILQGFAHSTLASAGPWLFTILALGAITVIGLRFGTLAVPAEFRLIIIYNFAFSLVFSGPVLMVVTRTLADLIYERRVEQAPGMLLGGLAVVLVTQLPLAIGFYVFYVETEPAVRIAAIANYAVVASLWLVAVFLSALKEYRSISAAFAGGMLLAVALSSWLVSDWGSAGLLAGFTIGLGMALFVLLARILAEYHYPAQALFAFTRRFRPYWAIAVGGLFYNAGIWVDKWIMWSAPESETLFNGMISYPHYDSAMFLAYLSITPGMAMFMMVVETQFFERYVHFFRDIQRHADFDRICINQRELIATLTGGARNLLVIQASLSLLTILLAPSIFQALGINFLQLGIFRLGVLGSLFHLLALMMLIVLIYFDFRPAALGINALLLLTNTVFTYASMKMGFGYYGYGYFLAALITFAAAYVVVYHHLNELPYQTFVRNNRSVVPGAGATASAG